MEKRTELLNRQHEPAKTYLVWIFCNSILVFSDILFCGGESCRCCRTNIHRWPTSSSTTATSGTGPSCFGNRSGSFCGGCTYRRRRRRSRNKIERGCRQQGSRGSQQNVVDVCRRFLVVVAVGRSRRGACRIHHHQCRWWTMMNA